MDPITGSLLQYGLAGIGLIALSGALVKLWADNKEKDKVINDLHEARLNDVKTFIEITQAPQKEQLELSKRMYDLILNIYNTRGK